MTKYSLSFKGQVATANLSETRSTRDVAIGFGIDHSMVRRWAKAYDLHGDYWLNKASVPYSIALKKSVVEAVLNDQTPIREACAIHKIPAYATVLAWVRLYNEGGIDALQNKPRGRPKMSKHEKPRPLLKRPLVEMILEELREELEYRRTEVAYLKK